jgi:hypothetical protein
MNLGKKKTTFEDFFFFLFSFWLGWSLKSGLRAGDAGAGQLERYLQAWGYIFKCESKGFPGFECHFKDISCAGHCDSRNPSYLGGRDQED